MSKSAAGTDTEQLSRYEAQHAGDTEPAMPDAASFAERGEAPASTTFRTDEIGWSDRLIIRLYGLGVPARLLTRPIGRTPRLRLLATVENPLPGSVVVGTSLRAGHFLVHGQRLAFDAADYADTATLSEPVADVLHGFTWLADLEASEIREVTAPIAERLLRDWLTVNPRPPRRPARFGAWTLARTGTRLLHWLVHAPLILSGNDKAARGATLSVIVTHARWLDRHTRRAVDAATAAPAWAALLAAGLLLPGGRPRELRAGAALLRALGEMIGDDGGVLSRSPMAQMETVALLVRLCACYRACRRKPPPDLSAMLALMVPPLTSLVHTDGGLGSWQGGWAIDRPRVAQLVAASGVPRRPSRDSHQWGYQRVSARSCVLQVDAAPPPMRRHARRGCAGTLAFELSHGEYRLVVNCGGAGAAGGVIPQSLARGLRATAAHSTLTLDDANSSAVLPNGSIGKGVATVDVERIAVAASSGMTSAVRIVAVHDGYAGRYGLLHRRTLELGDDGAELRGEDRLEPVARRHDLRRRRKVGFAIRFHLGPHVRCFVPERMGDGTQEVQLALPDGRIWRFAATDCMLSVDDSIWVDGAGEPVTIRQLVLHDVVGRAGGIYPWRFSLVR